MQQLEHILILLVNFYKYFRKANFVPISSLALGYTNTAVMERLFNMFAKRRNKLTNLDRILLSSHSRCFQLKLHSEFVLFTNIQRISLTFYQPFRVSSLISVDIFRCVDSDVSDYFILYAKLSRQSVRTEMTPN